MLPQWILENRPGVIYSKHVGSYYKVGIKMHLMLHQRTYIIFFWYINKWHNYYLKISVHERENNRKVCVQYNVILDDVYQVKFVLIKIGLRGSNKRT